MLVPRVNIKLRRGVQCSLSSETEVCCGNIFYVADGVLGLTTSRRCSGKVGQCTQVLQRALSSDLGISNVLRCKIMGTILFFTMYRWLHPVLLIFVTRGPATMVLCLGGSWTRLNYGNCVSLYVDTIQLLGMWIIGCNFKISAHFRGFRCRSTLQPFTADGKHGLLGRFALFPLSVSGMDGAYRRTGGGCR